MGVLSPLPHPLTLQLPVSIAGPGDDEGLADEKEGYFYPGCCIDRWLLPTHSPTHTHTHTRGAIGRYLLHIRKLVSIIKPFYSVSVSILLARLLQVFRMTVAVKALRAGVVRQSGRGWCWDGYTADPRISAADLWGS